jgi:GNAT superfamily N-acetyltransferase
MERIESIDKIRQLIAEVRAKRKGFLTNFYLDEEKHSVWIDKGVLYYIWEEDTCFFIHKKDSFWYVYYISTESIELRRALGCLKEKYNDISLVFDVVGRWEQCQQLLPLFQSNGFEEESSLVRFIKTTTFMERDSEIEAIQFANSEQVRQAHALLCRYMDDRVEQIPYMEEYENWGRLGHVLVCMVDGNIAGLFDFEKNATTMMTRHWLVHPDYRGKHIGAVLFRRFLYEANDTKRILSWVIRSNTVSIKNHLNYGFKEENLYDFVMTNKY